MKGKRVIVGFCFLLSCGILLSSCVKVNSGETIVLIGQEAYIDNIEELFADFKPSFDSVKKKMGIIYEGPVPPKIEGGYVMDTTLLVASNVDYMSDTVAMPEVYLRFNRQHNGIVTLDFKESSIRQGKDTVFVMGNDKGFTVYFKEKRKFKQLYDGKVYHVTMKRGIIMCGSVTPGGLSDFRYASIVMDTEDDSNGVLPQYEPGTYLIYEDADRMADTCTW